MSDVASALARAVRDLFNLQVLWVVVWPLLVASLLWLALAIVFWTPITAWTAAGLERIGIEDWLTGIKPVWLATGLQALLHVLVFIPLVYVTALVITALFAMPALIRVVAERDYPDLVRAHGGGLVGSVWNAVVAMFFFVLIWIITLPLWLIGVGVIVPFVAAAWLNQRLFRYDAVAEHASADEMAQLFKDERSGWWALGALTGLLQFVPLLNLLGAVVAALAFIHFGLARLARLRASPAYEAEP